MGELPPGVVEEYGQLYRYVTRTSAEGEEWQQRKRVARTLAEAKATRSDFYHQELGWIIEGYKLERDRPTESVLADASVPVAAPETEEEGD
jgi:hypothetical protein